MTTALDYSEDHSDPKAASPLPKPKDYEGPNGREWHLDQALLAEAKDEEIYKTIDVAIEMGGGPAGAYARFILKAWEYYKEKSKKFL